MIGEKLLSRIYRRIPLPARKLYSNGKCQISAALAKRRRRRMARSHGTFTARDLRECLHDLGVGPGADVIVQSSLAGMGTYRGRPDEILEILLDLITGTGTLCMPSYPKEFGRKVDIFDVKKTPSYAGIISELFRRHESSVRSLQPTHTVCALGPNADYFTKEHHLSPFPFGDKSPWSRIADVNGLLVGLGLPIGYTSVWHAVEDLLYPDFPVQVYYPDPWNLKVRDYQGVERQIPAFVHCHQVKVQHSRFLDELPAGAHRFKKFHGITIFVLEAEPFLRTMAEIAKGGRTIYD